MAAGKLTFDYTAMERHPGDPIRAEDWNAAMRAIADLVAALNAVVDETAQTGVTPTPATPSPATASADWVRSSPVAQTPARVGSITLGKGLRAVAIDAAYAYVSCQGKFRVLDRFPRMGVQAPDGPSVAPSITASFASLGETDCPDAQEISLAGGYAYLAGGNAGLGIVDIRDPYRPNVESFLPLGGELRRVYAEGNLAYVISYEQGLQIVSVADKRRPVLLSSLFIGMPTGIVVRNNYAYIADNDEGFFIVEVRNPKGPFILYRHGARDFGFGMDICLRGNLAYLADGDKNTIGIFDVSQPEATRLAGTIPYAAYRPNRLLIRGDVLLVATDVQQSSGLFAFDVAHGETALFKIPVSDSVYGIAADERFVYLAMPNGVLEIFDIRPPHLALPAGRIGIGTVTPQALLDVRGGTLLEQQPWQYADVLRGLVPRGDGYSPVQYFKDSLGMVHLRGAVWFGSPNTLVDPGGLIALPEGYRPEFNEYRRVCTGWPDGRNGLEGEVELSPNGIVSLSAGAFAWICLDGITFRAAG